jgi:two-component system, sensor histidine kinase and response regulator
MKVVDPACGMTVETENAFASSSYRGTIYYFCSEKCKEEFAKDPEISLTMMSEREKTVEAERSKSLQKMMDQVAHEMRNPLTSIGGFTRRMYEKLPEGDPNRKYLEVVIDDVLRLESMIRQLIEMKAIGIPHKEPWNVNDIIGEAIKLSEEELRDMNIEVRTELMDNPPIISIDRYKLTSAISNLIRNAVEAMEKAPGVLRISSRLNNGHIEIVVSDTGKGIPQEKINYIFDPFFTSKIYGPGLGLTFARRIIQEHKGTISVESEVGKGTSFTVRLPLMSSE